MVLEKTAKVFVFNYGRSFDYSDFLPYFSDKRLRRIEGCASDGMRMQLAAAELAVCAAMRSLGRPFAPPEYGYSGSGMPRIDGGFISISHTAGAAACAVSDAGVGVDIEMPRTVRRGLEKRIMCEEELRELELIFGNPSTCLGAPHPECVPSGGKDGEDESKIITERDIYLLETWVAKESLLKLTGEGLGGGMEKHRCDRPGGRVFMAEGGKSRPVTVCVLPPAKNDGGFAGNNRSPLISVCTDEGTETEFFAVEVSAGTAESIPFRAVRMVPQPVDARGNRRT